LLFNVTHSGVLYISERLRGLQNVTGYPLLPLSTGLVERRLWRRRLTQRQCRRKP